MSNLYLITTIALFTLSATTGSFAPSVKDDISAEGSLSSNDRRDIPDECNPIPFFHGHHHQHRVRASENGDKQPSHPTPPPRCCELPDIIGHNNEAFEKCHRIIHETFHPNPHHHVRGGGHGKNGWRTRHNFGGGNNNNNFGGSVNTNNNDNNDGQFEFVEPLQEAQIVKRAAVSSEENDDLPQNKETSFAEKMQERRDCFLNCLFNVTGYILSDNMLNEELLNQKLMEVVANDTKWAQIGETAFKKCIAAAKEANSQSQKVCKPGASEYIKCMSRELFFNCPTDVWVNTTECTDMKSRLEKCPNLMPPNGHRPHPHHRSHHHHRRRHHRPSFDQRPNENNLVL